ncbi:MAG: hypothetical protein KBF26_12575 [Opitutaceae bacterium]|nr:hypothetical protein [Opitutaceae bacterium]
MWAGAIAAALPALGPSMNTGVIPALLVSCWKQIRGLAVNSDVSLAGPCA